MRVLVACEESQEVCKAFREKGHEPYINGGVRMLTEVTENFRAGVNVIQKVRSKTFPGIAKAMADQWGDI